MKVDDDDYKKYNHLAWYLSDTGYAVRRTTDGTTRLHRLIMACPENMVVDHLNGDKLDCRKSNMRVCTQKDNNRNKHGARGYCFDKAKGKWQVRYRNKFFGRYDTEEEAARVYKLACSGVEYKPKQRQKYMLPKNIYRQGGSWGYGMQVDGFKYRKFGYATLAEAQRGLDNLKKKLQNERIGL